MKKLIAVVFVLMFSGCAEEEQVGTSASTMTSWVVVDKDIYFCWLGGTEWMVIKEEGKENGTVAAPGYPKFYAKGRPNCWKADIVDTITNVDLEMLQKIKRVDVEDASDQGGLNLRDLNPPKPLTAEQEEEKRIKALGSLF